jgi:hypothetical protein
MKWATRPNCHVDRTACAWLIRRFIDPEATFLFITDLDELPRDATPFDIRGAALSHRNGSCSFEVFLEHYELDDPVLEDMARIVHEADLDDERYDAPEAPGLDAVIRGLTLVTHDTRVLELSAALYDGLYEVRKRASTR